MMTDLSHLIALRDPGGARHAAPHQQAGEEERAAQFDGDRLIARHLEAAAADRECAPWS
jgi:hypothetical protein